MTILFRDKIKRILAVPIKLILFITIIVGVFLEAGVLKGLTISDIILFITLIVLIFYTFYTHQIVKITYQGPALVKVQIYHTDILKKFLKKWLEILEVPNYKYNSFKEFDDEFRSLENNWEFKDLIQNHLPEKYNDLREEWNKFKKDMIELNSLKREFYNTINNEIEIIFERLINEKVQKGQSYHIDELKNNIYILCFKNQDHEDSCLSLHIEKNNDNTFILMAYASYIILQNGTNDEMKHAKKELLKAQKDLRKRYGDTILKITGKYFETLAMSQKLKNELTELNTWPIFPGTKCDMLKDFELK